MNNERTERWKKIREYAMGKQDLQKYKDAMYRSRPENYISIDWGTKKIVAKIIKRIVGKHHQYIQNIKMVSRLLRINRKIRSKPTS